MKKIGIISAGDDPNDLERKINNFIKKEIEIIICCARSRNVKGSSYRMIIDKFSKNNKILKEVWVSHSPNRDEKETIKKQSVSEIIKAVNEGIK